MNENLNTRFIREIGNCNDPIVFLGVANVLGVKLLSEEKDEEGKFIPRKFEEIAVDVIDKFADFPRKKKRELLKAFKEANRSVVTAPT